MGTGDRKRRVGARGSVTIGEGWVYVGNRADSSVCAFHPRSLARGACHRLDAMPDGLAYARGHQEVWVTTPRDKSNSHSRCGSLEQKARLELDGNLKGSVVDAKRERFYTNLEDKDRTIGINLRTRKTVAVWKPSCGRGRAAWTSPRPRNHPSLRRVHRPRGDARHQVGRKGDLDARHRRGEWTISTTLPTPTCCTSAPRRAGQLTIARSDSAGNLTLVATVKTPVARNPAVTDKGVVYLAHSALR